MFWAALLIGALAGYLCGSFPAGFLAGKLRGVDLRKEGSGNIGATNALRVLGKWWGYVVFAVDMMKGFAGVKLAMLAGELLVPGLPSSMAAFGTAGAIGAVLGHNFPVWLGFRGGKGISTSAGVMLALFPLPVFVGGLVAWVGLFLITRYVSVASLAAAVSLPLTSAALWSAGHCDGLLVLVAAAMCALAVWRHRPNIIRLLSGTEKRFERAKKDVPDARSGG